MSKDQKSKKTGASDMPEEVGVAPKNKSLLEQELSRRLLQARLKEKDHHNKWSDVSPKGVIVRRVIRMEDILRFAAIVVIIALLFAGVKSYMAPKQISLPEAVEYLQEGKAKKVYIRGNEVEIELEDKSKYRTKLEPQISFTEVLQQEGISLNALKEKGIDLEVKDSVPGWLDLVDFGLNAMFVLLLSYAVLRFVRFLNTQSQRGGSFISFGKSPAKLILGKRPDTTLKDVAGLKEIKEEVQIIIDFLKDPKKYQKMGARIPKGILLEGPPGTGKTLLARAVAGEAHVPFFYTSGGEFEEMLVGAGAARVRDLFKKARALQPSIIFIDEIDAVAKKRGVDFRSTYSEQTLNQILAEMDGLEKDDSVIVMAATNRADILDPAIMRPGRFDWRIRFTLPDYKERLEILELYAKKKKVRDNVDLDSIAKLTVGFSGAELESALNEAAILAVRRGKSEITEEEILEGIFKVMNGPQRKSLVMSFEDLMNTAYHEAGHAIVSAFLEHAPEVQNITIIPRAKSLGATFITYEYEKTNKTFAELLDSIASVTAGRAAEELVYGKNNITTGAANDIEHASNVARAMVKTFGMSERLGFVNYGKPGEYLLMGLDREYSEETASEIDREVRTIVSAQYQRAMEILKREHKLLDAVAKALVTKETLTKRDFYALVDKYAVVKPPKKAKKEVKPFSEWLKKIKEGLENSNTSEE